MNNVFTFVRRLSSVIFLIGILLSNNIGLFADEKNTSRQIAMTADKISDEIAPFVDEDMVFVCYVDCVAMNKLHNLSTICDSLTKTGDDIVGLRVKIAFKKIDEYLRTEQLKGSFSLLVESNIDHFYIVFNLKYLHIGAFYVVPSVGGNAKKIEVVETFFGVQNKKDALMWSLTKDDYLIVGGIGNTALSHVTGWFRSQEGLGSIYSLVSMLTDDCRYTASGKFDVEHRKNLFKNYTSKSTPILRLALNELEESNALKIIILNTDTSAANEFLWCKNMKAPINQTSLDFVRSSKKYIVLGVDTDLPCIKICIQTDSPKKAESFKNYLITIIREASNNYFELPAAFSNDYEGRIADKEEWTKFLLLLAPKVKNDKLEININDSFFQKLSNK